MCLFIHTFTAFPVAFQLTNLPCWKLLTASPLPLGYELSLSMWHPRSHEDFSIYLPFHSHFLALRHLASKFYFSWVFIVPREKSATGHSFAFALVVHSLTFFLTIFPPEKLLCTLPSDPSSKKSSLMPLGWVGWPSSVLSRHRLLISCLSLITLRENHLFTPLPL